MSKEGFEAEKSFCDHVKAIPRNLVHFILVTIPCVLLAAPLSCFVWLLDVLVDLIGICTATWQRCIDTLEEKFDRTPPMVQSGYSAFAQGSCCAICIIEYAILAPLKEILNASAELLAQIMGETPTAEIPAGIAQASSPTATPQKEQQALFEAGEPGATSASADVRLEGVNVQRIVTEVDNAAALLEGAKVRIKERQTGESVQEEGRPETRPMKTTIVEDEESDTPDTDTDNEEEPDVYTRAKRLLHAYTRNDAERQDYFIQFCRILSRRKFRRTIVLLERKDMSKEEVRKAIRPIFRHLEPKTRDIDGTLDAIMSCFVENPEFRKLIASSVNAKMSAE